MPEATSTSGRNVGKIIEIKGVVLDAVFPDDLPEILSALEIELANGTLVAEVQQHLGDDRVRAVAMDSTESISPCWAPCRTTRGWLRSAPSA